MIDAERLIRDFTRVETLAFVPEVRLYLADRIVPLWQAIEWQSAAPVPPPFWAFAWPGSQALARYLLTNPMVVRGKRVLDVGAGSGLAAIVAARCAALEVVACDLDPVAATAQSLNAVLNGVTLTTWTGDACDVDFDAEVVLAGDVCYEREPAEALMAWLRTQAASGVRALLADPGRHYAPADGLELLATYDVPVLRELESVDTKRTRLWRLIANR